jgi:molybdate transport system substrate-binding protein
MLCQSSLVEQVVPMYAASVDTSPTVSFESGPLLARDAGQRDGPRVAMPGAFARLGPRLASAFTAASGCPITFAAFRPSGLLATAILAGEPADVYVSANVQWMRRMQQAGRVRRWATLARNRMSVIALPEVPVERLDDLRRPGLQVVAPQAATDPCGRYVELCWREAGLLPAMRAKQASGELFRSVGSGDLPAFVLDGRAQAGMLYISEARQLDPTLIDTVELPDDQDLHARIRFVVGALSPAGQPFVRWLLEPDAQAHFRAAGFLGPANCTRLEKFDGA